MLSEAAPRPAPPYARCINCEEFSCVIRVLAAACVGWARLADSSVTELGVAVLAAALAAPLILPPAMPRDAWYAPRNDDGFFVWGPGARP